MNDKVEVNVGLDRAALDVGVDNRRPWRKPVLDVKPVGETAGPRGISTENPPFTAS